MLQLIAVQRSCIRAAMCVCIKLYWIIGRVIFQTAAMFYSYRLEGLIRNQMSEESLKVTALQFS